MTIPEGGILGGSALIHDPYFLGPPELIVPTAQHSVLKFEYVFDEAPNNDDVFDAVITDMMGDVVPGYEFVATESSAGTVVFDLTPLVGEPFLGMGFTLGSSAEPPIPGSSATVSNVRLEPVPEPGTIAMCAVAAIGLGFTYWRRRRAT